MYAPFKKYCQEGRANIYDETLFYKLKLVLKDCGQDMESFCEKNFLWIVICMESL